MVHRHAHVDVMGDVDHDPMKEEVEALGCPQHRGALHLGLELVPLGLLPPLDVRGDVVDMDHGADEVGEPEERQHDRAGIEPQDAGH